MYLDYCYYRIDYLYYNLLKKNRVVYSYKRIFLYILFLYLYKKYTFCFVFILYSNDIVKIQSLTYNEQTTFLTQLKKEVENNSLNIPKIKGIKMFMERKIEGKIKKNLNL